MLKKIAVIRLVVASVCLAVSSLANAELVTHNNYTLNTSTNIVTHTDGTEWLQWDETKTKSISEAMSDYASDGWVLAGNAQMNALFANFGWTVGTDENTSYSTYTGYTSNVDDSSMDKFQELFGYTHFAEGGPFGYGVNAIMYSMAVYGDDGDNDGFFNFAVVISDSVVRGQPQPNHAELYKDSRDGNNMLTTADSSPQWGVALVRVTSVSEPASLAVFALGIMGLASRRFKKQPNRQER
jgi:hypothetical protein